MDILFDDLNILLKPTWGSEKWIAEGWNKITAEEKKDVKNRVDKMFENGLPFTLNHDKLLYIYIFSLMAQLEVLGIQLPMQFENKIQNPELKKRMRAQLVDEVFHAIVFTKVAFMLSEPFHSPPKYNQQIEKVCDFIRSQNCLKVGVVVMNLVCEGLIEEVFSSLYKNNIAPDLFKIILEDEHRHVCEAELYSEIGLPEKEILEETLKKLEELLVYSFTLQPEYSMALSSVLGPENSIIFLKDLNNKYINQLKYINMSPSEKWELAFYFGSEINKEFEHQQAEINDEISQKFVEVNMSPTRKMLTSYLNNPGDPTMVAQFNVDISSFAFFENKYPGELLTALMMQAISKTLASHDNLRHFLSYKKMYCSKEAYVAVTEKLDDCNDHIGTIFFRNCHETTASNLLSRIKRNKQMMTFCYKKREQVELDNPEFEQRWKEHHFDNFADNIYPYPLPGAYGAYLRNIGSYGYTQAKAPLLKHTSLHVSLLAVERKQVWNAATNSFEIKDLLPVSISADSRIFDELLPIPQLINEAFQDVFQKLLEESSKNSTENEYNEIIDQVTEKLLTKKNIVRGGKIIYYLKNKKIVLKEAKKLFGEDIEIYGKKLSQYTQFDSLANQLILDYLGFNAEEARNNERFTKLVDKMLSENIELGYRALYGMQTAWFDYIDTESAFTAVYEKIAQSRLHKLAKWMPEIVNKI